MSTVQHLSIGNCTYRWRCDALISERGLSDNGDLRTVRKGMGRYCFCTYNRGLRALSSGLQHESVKQTGMGIRLISGNHQYWLILWTTKRLSSLTKIFGIE